MKRPFNPGHRVKISGYVSLSRTMQPMILTGVRGTVKANRDDGGLLVELDAEWDNVEVLVYDNAEVKRLRVVES